MAWIITSGEVISVGFEGKLAKVKESFTKRDGTEGAAYFSAFFEAPHGLDVGAKGKFSGVLGVKPDIYEGKAKADVTINQTRFEVAEDEDAF